MKPKAVGLVGDGTNGSQMRIHKVINRKLTDAAGKGGRGVLEVVRVELDHMNGVNLATALHRIARRCVENEAEHSASSQQAIKEVLAHPAFPALLAAVERSSKESLAGREAEDIYMPAQCASIVAWSLAWLNLRQSKLFAVLGELAAPRLAEFKPYEVTNMLWAFAKLQEWNTQLFSAVAARLRERQKWEFKAQCLSVAAWSFTTMRWRDEPLFLSMAEELSGQATLLKPQEISNTLWAFGKQKIAHKELFEALGWSAFDLVWQARLKPKELANSLSAFAQVGTSHPNLFNNAMSMVMRRAHDFSPQQITSILCAYQRLQVANTWELTSKVLTVVACRVDAFQPQELCSILRVAIWSAKEGRPGTANAQEKIMEVVNRIEECEAVKSAAVLQTIKEVREKMKTRSFEKGMVETLSFSSELQESSGDEWYEECQSKATSVEVGKVDQLTDVYDGYGHGPRGSPLLPDARLLGTLPKSLESAHPPGLEGFQPQLGPWQAPWSIEKPGLQMIPTPIQAAPQLLPAAPQPLPAAPQPLPAAPALPVFADVLPVSCLLEEAVHGVETPVKAGTLECKATGMKWKPQPLLLRHGRFNQRVVLRPLEPGIPLPSFSHRHHSPHVLQPIAAIRDSPSGDTWRDGKCYLAFPFCQYGNLVEYVMLQKAMDVRLSARHAAMIARDVVLGVEGLMESDCEHSPAQVVSSIMPTKIFIASNGTAKVMAPINTGRPQSWRKMAMTMKWMSPEEVQDVPVERSNMWQVISYRVGLLLYCLGSQDAGIGYMVPNFVQDAPNSNQVDMAQCQQSGLLRQLVEECLRLGQLCVPPPRDILMSMLDAIIMG